MRLIFMRSLAKTVAIPAAMVLAAACGSAGSAPDAKAPRNTPELPATPSSAATVTAEQATFTLIISNQSFDDPSVEIHVTIDGATVVDGEFAVGSQHHFVPYPLRLGSGPHRLVARSGTGASLDRTFEIPARGQRWATMFYWRSEDEPKRFEWHEHDEPPVFA